VTHEGWTGGAPGASERAAAHVEGTALRFMWDYGVVVPLWDASGLLPDDRAWLEAALGLPGSTVDDLRAWGEAMQHLDANPRLGTPKAYRDLDRQAKKLVARLEDELAGRFTVTYVSW
jgi:hypothetical protein